MTFKGDTIIGKPTIAMIEIYIAEKGLYITPKQVWDYWDKKNWNTNNGTPLKTLESAINVANGIVIQQDFYKGIKLSGKTKTQKKKEKSAIRKSLQSEIIIAKRKEKEVIKTNETTKPYYKYIEQLKDERWLAFRQFIFKVRGKKCEICGSTKTLQVHHIHYNKNAMAWEYNCNEVMVVCKKCHEKLHGIIK